MTDLMQRFSSDAQPGHPNVTPKDASTLILLDRTGRIPKVFYESDDPNRRVPIVWKPEDFMIAVGGDPLESVGKMRKGSQVTCEVMAVQENGIEVKLADSDVTTFIKRSDLSRDRSEQRPERFNVGDKVDAAVVSVDRNSRRINVSIKALEIAEEKQAVAQYGSSDSGASLGDIFKAAIKKKEGGEDTKDEGEAEGEGKPS